MWEQGSLLALVAPLLLWLQYFRSNTLAQGAFFSLWNQWNLQLSLDRRAIFLPFADCSPNPPSSLDFINLSQPTQWIFLVAFNDPQRKLQFTLSNPSKILLGKWVYCITYEGTTAKEAWMRTVLPTKEHVSLPTREFLFHSIKNEIVLLRWRVRML